MVCQDHGYRLLGTNPGQLMAKPALNRPFFMVNRPLFMNWPLGKPALWPNLVNRPSGPSSVSGKLAPFGKLAHSPSFA